MYYELQNTIYANTSIHETKYLTNTGHLPISIYPTENFLRNVGYLHCTISYHNNILFLFCLMQKPYCYTVLMRLWCC